MELISREEARSKGLKRFYTGEPCKHGHIDERYVSTGYCAECHRVSYRVGYVKRRDGNPSDSFAEWAIAHPEQVKPLEKAASPTFGGVGSARKWLKKHRSKSR